MHTPVDIGLTGIICLVDSLYHATWSLRCGRVVEIYEPTVIYAALEYWEFLSETVDIHIVI